ncbi:4927_t:CDS:2 [Diversispora eburnea]|uniref:4927_t:CDS:1 n=1 Tax=Diversispora eburnea TaxID=1213867 RepID=A0A9N9GD19_9GLOM|nr:4927_t:CDS:2 [Diversispora eburnea]
MVQPKHILQNILEGLFGTIRELGEDSSIQILKSYGYALNKYQITVLVSSEIKSFNYGNASCNRHEINNLFMGKIKIPLEAYNENVKQENNNVLYLQSEWNNLIKTILYQDSIDKLLEK